MPTKTAFLAWELGGGLGHARRLLQVACELQGRGWLPIVAARELWACADEYRRASIPLLQAPLHRGLAPQESARFRARSLADILAACGYRNIEELETVVSVWDSLLDMTRPAVVVTDYSPMLALAAHGRVPVVAIGDGFVLPPPQLRMLPVLRSGTNQMPSEDELLVNAATLQRQRGLPVPQSLPALIGGTAHVVCTYQETDIFSDDRIEPATGPIAKAPRQLAPPARRAIFAYLAADTQRTAKLMQVLVDSRAPVEAFVRDAPDGMGRALRAAGVQLHETPPPLAEIAKRAGVIVHHGGIGTIEACLALGRPQLLMPKHLEQWQNAARLMRLGAAITLNEGFSLAEGAQAILEALSSERLCERAQELAAELSSRPSRSLERIVAFCEGLGKA